MDQSNVISKALGKNRTKPEAKPGLMKQACVYPAASCREAMQRRSFRESQAWNNTITWSSHWGLIANSGTAGAALSGEGEMYSHIWFRIVCQKATSLTQAGGAQVLPWLQRHRVVTIIFNPLDSFCHFAVTLPSAFSSIVAR